MFHFLLFYRFLNFFYLLSSSISRMDEAPLIEAISTYQFQSFQTALTSLKAENNGFEPEQQKSLIDRSIRAKGLTLGGICPKVEDVKAFIKFVFEVAKQELCSKNITIQVLQDIFDVSTARSCEKMFEIVEDNVDTWKTVSFDANNKTFFFDSCKNQILRMCNDLLKRLSRTVDTTFCGRILVLLAKALPFNEKSGLNLTGQFNTKNITTFEQEKKEQLLEDNGQLEDGDQPPPLPVEDDMEMGEIREQLDANGAISVDHSIYVKFWEIQKYFSSPNLLSEANAFTHFNEVLSEVLGILSSFRQLENTSLLNNDRTAEGRSQTEPTGMEVDDFLPTSSHHNGQLNGDDYYRKMEEEEDEMNMADKKSLNTDKIYFQPEHPFFAKYLTSQKLFPLQLADSQFRRYFLLQYLIITNYLTQKVKLKESFILTTEQEEKLREVANKCFDLLRETQPNGSLFAYAVKRVLNRERQWSAWKNEGCPDYITPLLNSSATKCSLLKRKEPNQSVPGQLDLGNKELTRLWNIHCDNLLACKEQQRRTAPKLIQLLEDALDEMDPEQQVEEQYQSVNDEKYQWMASRFLLLNSEQYLCSTPQDSKTALTTAEFLRKTIQLTAENFPQLKERTEQIQAAIRKRENIEKEERLAAAAKEREMLEKKKEEERALRKKVAKQLKERTEQIQAAESKGREMLERKKDVEIAPKLNTKQLKERSEQSQVAEPKEREMLEKKKDVETTPKQNSKQLKERTEQTQATEAKGREMLLEKKKDVETVPKQKITAGQPVPETKNHRRTKHRRDRTPSQDKSRRLSKRSRQK